jgi:hypothetical protein
LTAKRWLRSKKSSRLAKQPLFMHDLLMSLHKKGAPAPFCYFIDTRL